MWPAVVLLALMIGRPWRLPVRALVGLAGLGTQWPVLEGILGNWRLDALESVIAVVWYLPMLGLEAWAFSVAFVPSPEGLLVSHRVKRTLIGLGVGAVAMVAVVAVGVGG